LEVVKPVRPLLEQQPFSGSASRSSSASLPPAGFGALDPGPRSSAPNDPFQVG
jgi:hypothetical protein